MISSAVTKKKHVAMKTVGKVNNIIKILTFSVTISIINEIIRKKNYISWLVQTCSIIWVLNTVPVLLAKIQENHLAVVEDVGCHQAIPFPMRWRWFMSMQQRDKNAAQKGVDPSSLIVASLCPPPPPGNTDVSFSKMPPVIVASSAVDDASR